MKPASLLFALASLLSLSAIAQPSTEVYLFDLKANGETISVSNPINVSANPGRYDNQPSFSQKTGELFFVSQDATPQIDIFIYNPARGTKINFSDNASNEYSPTLTPDGKHISCIREVDGTQLLWKFPIRKGEPVIVVPDLVIGYHAWRDDNTLVSFVLGEPQTLQISNLSAKTNTIVASNIGRSIHNIPGSQLISFLQNREGQPALIQSLDTETAKIETICEAMADSQDMAWTPDGKIIMGQGSKLFTWSASTKAWIEIAELASTFQLKGITRLAVGPKGDKLAVVVNE
ncbi:MULTISPECIES: hypothetical protein [unclassified Imperialibacter]|uniref:TolB family protein n=1 Tax=unclassified Imperialibacter TaxID=2629706 RepID=UPI00125C9294|nr:MULTISPECIES: hypothetical protein [unclassified Imperialibacter]CAD5273851.1 conserved exported hypothetical protein [Imperialibacter sp. 75]CAD5274218.1 conserved exported hypothetical protein [Imperialibacter sp. 89]VVT22581.1 conserved exported hypothetical protein [Imperialibacter sp. EC-SDR9]